MRVGTYWHVFPTYSEAKDAVWRDPNMLFNIIPEPLIEKKNEQELVVYFKNGSILQLKGADKPERLLGSGPVGVVLDEFAEMKYETWQRIVQPIIRANDGWTWFVGTPKGKNHLFDLYQLGQEGHNEWQSWLLEADKSGIIDQQQLENSKRTMSESLYNQEFLCKFLEGEGSVFRGVRKIMTAIPQKPMADHLYVMGVDLAKVSDYTVLTIYDRKNNVQVYQDRFRRLEWPYQKMKIIETAKHYNNALCVVDATGIGDPIVDDLQRAGVFVKPYKITNTSKKEMIEKLSIYIEQRKIKMLPMKETKFEFDNFSYDIGSTGTIRYQARQGFHDDIVISHALAVSDLFPVVPKKRVKPPSRLRLHLIKSLKQKQYEEIQSW